MQPYSDYEIAQRRIAERQRKKTRFHIALAFLAVPLLIICFSPDVFVTLCMIPFVVITGLFVITTWVDLYYSSPKHAPSEQEIQEETEWLYGQHNLNELSAQAIMFAHDRIRKRRIGRWRFWGHALLFVPTSGILILDAFQIPNFSLLVSTMAWLFVFVLHARSALPSKRHLEKREKGFGYTLQFELGYLRPEKAKTREKLKRGKYYEVGDDGELVEVDDEIMGLDEKPKRAMRDDR